MDYVSNTDIKKIYFIIYEKTNEHNKAEARVLFFLCIWAVVGLFFTVTIHVDRAEKIVSAKYGRYGLFFIFNIHLNSSVFVSSRIGSDESSTALSSNLWFGLVTWKRVVYLLGGRD